MAGAVECRYVFLTLTLCKGGTHNLEDKVMMDQQEFNLCLGYLKYSAPKPIRELVDLSYAEAAVKQMGRK